MTLPDYIITTIDAKERPSVLTTPAEALKFPLTQEDMEHIATLEAKFDSEGPHMVGLAAPQIGIGKQIVIIKTPDGPEFKKWRPDLTQTIKKTILINPEYERVGEEKEEGWEACYSVAEYVGKVSRYHKVSYRAFDQQGNKIEGTAEGYLARMIQHETDHIRGKLFIDYIVPGTLMTLEKYKEMRAAALAGKQDRV